MEKFVLFLMQRAKVSHYTVCDDEFWGYLIILHMNMLSV